MSVHKKTCSRMFVAALLIIIKIQKQSGVTQARKRVCISFIVKYQHIATQMNLKNILLNKRSLTSNSKYQMIHSTSFTQANLLHGRGKVRTMVGLERKEEEVTTAQKGMRFMASKAPYLSLPLSRPHSCWKI